MPVERLNPPTLPEPVGFVQIGIASGSRLVFLSGQVANDTAGRLVGTADLAAQTEQVVLNVAAGLEAAGASIDDVAKVTVYVVDWEPSKLDQLVSGVMNAAGQLNAVPLAPTTLVPVSRLFGDGYLVEFDVTAVVA